MAASYDVAPVRRRPIIDFDFESSRGDKKELKQILMDNGVSK